VIYLPETERRSHYFSARIAAQFDAVIHLDRTRALDELRVQGAPAEADLPQTYPVAV